MAAGYTIICELRLRVGMRKQMHLFQNIAASITRLAKIFESNFLRIYFSLLARFYSVKKLIDFGGRRRKISYKISARAFRNYNCNCCRVLRD